jgi:hypothetical protein
MPPRPDPATRPRRLLYRGAVLLGGALLAYLSFAVTLANVAATQAPGLALSLWPGHAAAEARMADAIFASNPRRPPVAAAAGHAAAALRRSPTLPAAARILALNAGMQGREAQSGRLIHYAAAMSKRDIPTQFWLLEERVAANDVPGALSHFGIALSVAPGTADVLFPVLTGALSQADLVQPIAGLVRDGNSWRSDFLYHAATNSRDPAAVASLFLTLNRLGTRPAPAHIQVLMGRLVEARNMAAAGRLYGLIDPRWRREDVNSQIDGRFERTSDVPPFGWTINPDLAWRGAKSDAPDDVALHFTASATGQGWVAKRQIVLPPGTYGIGGRVRAVDGGATGRLRIGLSCAIQEIPTSVANFPLRGSGGAFHGTISASGACPAQWLTIIIDSQTSQSPVTFWVDDLRLESARPGA